MSGRRVGGGLGRDVMPTDLSIGSGAVQQVVWHDDLRVPRFAEGRSLEPPRSGPLAMSTSTAAMRCRSGSLDW